MTHTQEMLESSPARAPLGVEELAAAIDAALACVQTCTTCADASLAEDDVAGLRRCIALCHACTELCSSTAGTLSRAGAWDHLVAHRLLQACVQACSSCAEECARHADHHRHCGICAQTCRACVHACNELLEAEAFEELQKLAGG